MPGQLVTAYPTPRPIAPRWRLGGCVLAALGLHAALGIGLFMRAQAMVPGAAAAAPGAQTRSTSAAMHMTMRWTLAAAAKPAVAETHTAPASPVEAPTEALMQAPLDAPVLADAPEPLPDATSAQGEAPFTGYAHRDMLDRAPQALGIVQISYPPGVEPGRVHTGRLTLFIDEAGAVRKVMVHGATDDADADSALPPPFVQAAREAFLQARFAPGERQGQPVKSRIDIEVSFDGRDTAPASTIDTAQQPLAPAENGRSV